MAIGQERRVETTREDDKSWTGDQLGARVVFRHRNRPDDQSEVAIIQSVRPAHATPRVVVRSLDEQRQNRSGRLNDLNEFRI